jgi:hypothetical protein
MKKNFISNEVGFIYKNVNIIHDDATKNKIRRHLLDINDVISEEDIRSILVTFPGAENERKNSQSIEEKLFEA